jgi:hypothetical protein
MSEWFPISSVPVDRDVEVSVSDRRRYHAFGFPVRRTLDGWVCDQARGVVSIDPTHWREWRDQT